MRVMFVIALQSGSNGNCYYVEAEGVRLLVDAGISGVLAQERLARHGLDIRAVDALLISHDHSDHCQSMGVYQRKFGLPIHVTGKTLHAADRRQRFGPLDRILPFHAGAVLRFGAVAVQTVRTPHDGADGVVFVIDDGRRRLGILTDLGHVFPGLEEVIGSLDAVILESNYDPEMLRDGPYPAFLKKRIRGPGGHLSNVEAAELLRSGGGSRLKWACLAHLSADNNHPELALRTHRARLGGRFPIHVASRHEATGVLEV